MYCSTVPDMTVLCVFVLYSYFNYHELTSVKSTRAASEDLCKCISCSGLDAANCVRKLSGIQCIGEEAQVLHRFSVSWISHLFSHSSYVAYQFVKYTASREVLSSVYLDWMIWSRDLFPCVSWKHSWNSCIYPPNKQAVTIQCSKRMALQQVTLHIAE